jgi:hypothetical protein
MDPIAYLQFHGWASSTHPMREDCRWYDPKAPTKETIIEEPVWQMTPDRTQRAKHPETGQDMPLMELVIDKKTNQQVKRQIVQKVVIPPAWPMSREQAVRIQMARDKS